MDQSLIWRLCQSIQTLYLEIEGVTNNEQLIPVNVL